MDIGSAADEAESERKRVESMRRFTKVAKLSRDLRALEERLVLTPGRYVHVREQLCRDVLRSRIKLSRAIRELPFSAAKWTAFRVAFTAAANELLSLEAELDKREHNVKSSAIRESETPAS